MNYCIIFEVVYVFFMKIVFYLVFYCSLQMIFVELKMFFYGMANRNGRTGFNDYQWGCPRGVMVKAMNCGIVVREFVLQSRYYVLFRANTLGKGMNPLIFPPAMGK